MAEEDDGHDSIEQDGDGESFGVHCDGELRGGERWGLHVAKKVEPIHRLGACEVEGPWHVAFREEG